MSTSYLHVVHNYNHVPHMGHSHVRLETDVKFCGYFAVCNRVSGGSTVHSLANFFIAVALTGVAMAVLF